MWIDPKIACLIQNYDLKIYTIEHKLSSKLIIKFYPPNILITYELNP